ncbi:hypothetical protein [Nocardioides sp.]|uniref:hypothetical protein n=1 Tax=Nocardioides sp. TaxID=35761 RepID=UPI0031FEF9B6|nr:hypothetical protein [Nocardioides sp.]
MSPEEQQVEKSADDSAHEPAEDATEEPEGEPVRKPDWWHRDHPTFTALTGFFTGLFFVILVPGVFAGILNALFSYHRAENLFPFVVITLFVPLGLVIVPRTRRFGLYMWIGMALTLLVVAGVAGLVLWYMVKYQG